LKATLLLIERVLMKDVMTCATPEEVRGMIKKLPRECCSSLITQKSPNWPKLKVIPVSSVPCELNSELCNLLACAYGRYSSMCTKV